MIPINEQPYPLPEGWQWIRQKNICELSQGEKLSDKMFPYLDVKYLRGMKEKSFVNSGNFIKAGTKIILVDGENSGEIFTAPEVGYMGSTFRVLNISESVNADFFQYFASTKKDFYKKNKRGSAIPHLNKNLFYAMLFPLPPIDEQQRIVALLDELFANLDEAKTLVQAVVDGSELRRAAILHKAFTGELSKIWREEHGITLDSWQQIQLGDVCQINPPKISTRNLSNDLKVSFVPMAAVSDVRGEITVPQRKNLCEVKSGFTNFAEGDVLFAKITPCMENGKAALVDKLVNHIGYGSTEFFVLRCGEKIFNRFVYHLVRWKIFRDEAKSVMAGAVGQQRVPKQFLTGYQLNLPPLEEQKEIVRLLDDLLGREQRTKDIALQTIEHVETMKKSILARAFRGKLSTK